MKAAAVFLSGILFLTAETPARPRITGISHIALYSKDLQQSRSFYSDFLGFRELEQPSSKPGAAYFQVNDRQYVELLPERQPGTDRLHHIALQTDNADAMRAYLQVRGVAVPGGLTKDANGNLSFEFRDPEGHLVEMIQYGGKGRFPGQHGVTSTDVPISKRIMHTGIIVTRLAPEMKFYTDILGFPEFWRGSSSGAQLSWINLKVPDGEDYIELMLHKEAPAPTARGSAHHLCLEAPDVNAILQILETKPYRSNYSRSLAARVGRNRRRQLNIFDPDGTRTELMEPKTVDGKPAPSSDAPPPN